MCTFVFFSCSSLFRYIGRSSAAKFAEYLPRQKQPQVGDRILTIELLNADGKEIIAYGALADKKSLVNKGTFPRGLWQPVATVQLTIRRRRSQQVSFKVEGSGQVKILVIQHYTDMNYLEQHPASCGFTVQGLVCFCTLGSMFRARLQL
ncbi:RAD5 [Symbiodinium sp. KB8]|nr:RAD5 [Symbiodinium sp. KB8]